jgi:hypothetical protein
MISPREFRLRMVAKILPVAALTLISISTDRVVAQNGSPVEISSPVDGDVLTGVVEIQGTVTAQNFLSATLAFAYDGVQDAEWFNITEIPQPVNRTQLALWDTGAISDGAYILRLRLNGTDGTVQDAVARVQVRNYTSAPTSVPTPTFTAQPALEVSTPVVIGATPTFLRTQPGTPTAFPANPARLTQGDILAGITRGGSAVLAVFLLWGAVTLRRRI